MNRLSETQLVQLSDFVNVRMGLYFPRTRWNDLERNIDLAAREFGFNDADTFLAWLLTSPLDREQMEILASHLTIAETYFWREPQVFAALRDRILPELLRAREKEARRLRIWSAGCATGEEPYSIAILLNQLIPDLEKWHVTLLATDINPRILQRAAAGVYRKWSFRNVPAGFQETWFTRIDNDAYEILPHIRRMVTFAYLNLAEDLYPAVMNNTNAMDIIFCRNVLMYFTPERARQVGQRLFRSLFKGGWLMVGASELSRQIFPQFTAVHFDGAMIYQREDGTTETTRAPHFKPASKATVTPQPSISTTKAAPVLSHASSALRNMAKRTPSEQVNPPVEGVPADTAQTVRALANEGNLQEARDACEEAIAANRLEPGLHYLEAVILQELGREEEALKALRNALYLDPDFVLAHFALANMELHRGNARVARRSFENALKLLNVREQDEILPEAEGLTAGRFREIIHANLEAEALL